MSDLPPGFVMDAAPVQAAPAGLPPGFVIDGAASAPPEKKKFGLGDTWPARLAKSIASATALPGDVYQGKTAVDPSNPEFIGRVTDLATLASPMAPRVAATAEIPRAAAIPTSEELKTTAGQGYEAARNSGVEIHPEAVKNTAAVLQANLEKDGINGELAPKTFSIIKRMQEIPANAVGSDLSNLETVRRSLGHAAADFTNPTEKLAASRAIEHIDDYLGSIPKGDVVAGDAAAASKTLEDARGNYAAAKRSELVDSKIENADVRSAVANSGQNFANTARQRIADILLQPKLKRGFSAEELAQMEKIARGTKVGNTARFTGNLFGGGGGLGGLLTAEGGHAAFGPAGYALPAVGYGLKKIANASTERQIKILDELIRSRSPMAKSSPEITAERTNPKMAAILSALMTRNQDQRQQQ